VCDGHTAAFSPNGTFRATVSAARDDFEWPPTSRDRATTTANRTTGVTFGTLEVE